MDQLNSAGLWGGSFGGRISGAPSDRRFRAGRFSRRCFSGDEVPSESGHRRGPGCPRPPGAPVAGPLFGGAPGALISEAAL